MRVQACTYHVGNVPNTVSQSGTIACGVNGERKQVVVNRFAGSKLDEESSAKHFLGSTKEMSKLPSLEMARP